MPRVLEHIIAEECDYIAAYDMYSFGAVMAEQILGRLNRDPTDVFQTYVLAGKTPIVDGWKLLERDADNQVKWGLDALQLVCRIAIGCITPPYDGRLSTDKLLPLLNHAIKFQAGISEFESERKCIEDLLSPFSASELNTGERKSEPEGALQDPCAVCNRSHCGRGVTTLPPMICILLVLSWLS